MENILLTNVKLGAYQLKNRIIMPPLTRMRSPEGIPNALNVLYYSQRSSAGLIITEATCISRQGKGFPDTPGIYSDAQVQGWKQVTDAVHKNGGLIFLQLWHVGRISHSSHQLNNELPVAPSAVKANGTTYNASWERVPFETPRALKSEEIQNIISDYKQAAINAKTAGFDGVELHALNGYLIQQFLQSATNKRTDQYGGSAANKSRILFEALNALTAVWGEDKVGVRLSPFSTTQDSFDPDSYPTYTYVVNELAKYNLAYLHLVRHVPAELTDQHVAEKENALWKLYPGNIIAAQSFTVDAASAYINSGKATAIAFGSMYIANPDLPERIASGAVLNNFDPKSSYGGGEEGYTDYPFLSLEG